MGALGRAGSGAARSWGLVDRGVGGAGAPCVWLLASPCTTRGDHTVTVLLVRLRHERASANASASRTSSRARRRAAAGQAGGLLRCDPRGR